MKRQLESLVFTPFVTGRSDSFHLYTIGTANEWNFVPYVWNDTIIQYRYCEGQSEKVSSSLMRTIYVNIFIVI